MVPAVKYSSEKMERLRKQLADNPDSFQAHHRLGMALYKNGALKEAARLLRRAVELDPESAEAWINLGGILLSAWDFEGCIDANLKAASCRPDLMQAHYNQGLGHMYLGQAEEMVSCFKRVLELDFENAGGHYHLAVGLLALEKANDARISIDRAMQLGYNPEPGFLKALEKQTGKLPDGGVAIPTTHHS